MSVIGLFPGRAVATPSLAAVTPLEGLNTIIGVALSADGSTVVGSRPRQDRTTLIIHNRAFVWTQVDGYRLIDELGPGAPSSSFFQPHDVSGDGSRIVGSLDGAPILWERGGATTSLALLPGGTSGATAYAISDDGRHVVGTAHDGGTVSRVVLPPGGGPVIIEEPRRVPVSWNVDDGTVIAMTIERGAARDVSNDGVAVGELQLGIPQVVEVTAGFRWDSGRGSQFVPNDDLGSSLPWVQGSAAISADGSTLVGRTFGPPPPGSTVSGIFERAYVWNGSPGEETSLPTDGLALIDVPASLSGYSESEATGVSADGSTIVGGYYRDGIRFGSLSPFIWTREGGFQDLELLLHTLGVPTDGWELLGATDVSADGKTIIGMGRTRNELGRRSDTVWIAVIPEPSVSLLIAVGLSILAGTARARDGR